MSTLTERLEENEIDFTENDNVVTLSFDDALSAFDVIFNSGDENE